MIFKKKEKIYAFIDSQNLNLGIKNDIFRQGKKIFKGWKLDFKKFRIYLKDKYHVTEAFLFIGYLEENEDLYKALGNHGYKLIYKPTIKDNHGDAKGNVDAELVLYSSRIEYDNYDKAVIVSGDGDFYCLIDYLAKQNKLSKILVPNQYSYSSLLSGHKSYISYINQTKSKLEYRSKPKKQIEKKA